MAIRKSAAAEIEQLLDDLSGTDDVARDTAAARLSVIGIRAVPHLVRAFEHTGSAIARTAILSVLEAHPDRRGLEIALDQLDDATADPRVRSAALAVVGAHLDGDDSVRALDALSAIALDRGRPDVIRIQAIGILERTLPALIDPLRARLAKDRSAAIRQMVASGPATTLPAVDPRAAVEAAAAGDPADPALLRVLVPEGAAETPLPVLHRLIEAAKAREDRSSAEADRLEWQRLRGAVHFALALRGSRVALYDLRETLAGAPAALPADFIAAVGLVGDRSCLDPIADALARVATRVDARDQAWRTDLVRAGRAIVQREGLTRRHASIRKIAKAWPAVADVLLAGDASRQS